MTGSIYLVVNRVNGFAYVGQTIQNIYKRMQFYLNPASRSLLTKAYRKHGAANFDACVLETCEKEKLNERERYWISRLGCVVPDGYNLAHGGNAASGYRHTQEMRSRSSERRRGNKNPNFGNHAPWSEARRLADNNRTDRRCSPECREKLRITHKKKWKDPVFKAKRLADFKKNRGPLTDETREKMSRSAIARGHNGRKEVAA